LRWPHSIVDELHANVITSTSFEEFNESVITPIIATVIYKLGPIVIILNY